MGTLHGWWIGHIRRFVVMWRKVFILRIGVVTLETVDLARDEKLLGFAALTPTYVIDT